MKRFFAKASKPFVLPRSLTELGATLPPTATSTPGPTGMHTTTGIQPTSGLQPKYVIPAVPHPCPYDHLALLVSKDGLLIQQHIPGQTQQPLSYVRVAWGKSVRIEEIPDHSKVYNVFWDDVVIVYGILGILELFSGSYLLVITSRTEVGNVIDRSRTVYGVKGVTAVPLVEERARIVLNTLASRNAQLARPSLLKTTAPGPETEDEENPPQDTPDVSRRSRLDQVRFTSQPGSSFRDDLAKSYLSPQRSSSPLSFSSDLSTLSSEVPATPTSVANALASRLSFWTGISKRSSHSSNQASTENHEPPTLTQEHEEPATALGSILATVAPPPDSVEGRHSELEEKIIRECIREFTKGGMYFSYNFDITRSLQHKQDKIAKSTKQHDLLANLNALPIPEVVSEVVGTKNSPMSEPNPRLPLWRRVDKRFWWNEWLSKPFVDAGLHPYVLPVMQGYCQISHFNIPPDPTTHDEEVLVEYVIISRRSRLRAGLRYQRRGIDDDANVANFVETETIMRVERLGIENVFAFVQIRGSIPLYWTQSGYGLKPPPLLAPDRTHAQNLDALKRHFERTVPLYGYHTALNLAEQSGKEGAITQSYREYMHELGSQDVCYREYDFHMETRGMKYENISNLIERMGKIFDSQGYLWISNDTIMSQQKGVFRVNCIDCLDRTNVVQSAFARYVLSKQLGAVALLNPESEGRSEIDITFNDVWANNGDAISRAYAGTSALKGDFTRTGRRDLSGLLNDGVNSLARMYTSTFSDWFSQAVIDFVLGNRTIIVFSEFLLKLQSTDPRDLIRLSKIRAEAIATSVSRVLPEGERFLSGWTLFAPEELNTKMGDKFEEKVLLLSTQGLYIICYDYTLEKVKMYTRIPLWDIIGISKGAYILSPLEEASRDPIHNAGFVVTWHNSNQVTRVTSYSVRNSVPQTATPGGSKASILVSSQKPGINSARLTRSLTRGKARVPTLSNILTNAALATRAETTYAAFKVLPIDPARMRRASSTGGNIEYTEAADELSGALSCQEAVSMVVDSIRRACEDVGGARGDFITIEDVVSLAEAQRMTSVYAKMEYGVKRLLWLGG